jgi:hypothetical protein
MAESISLVRPPELETSEGSSNMNCVDKYLEHNQNVLGELNLGDLIEYKRNLYSDWAIYIGKNKVIHLQNDNCKTKSTINGSLNTSTPLVNNARVIISNYFDVVKDSLAYRNNSADNEMEPLPVQQILTRAFEQVDTQKFSLFSYDSEKFAKSCRYGPNVGCYSMPVDLLTIGYRVNRNLKKMYDSCVDFLNRKSTSANFLSDERENNEKQS